MKNATEMLEHLRDFVKKSFDKSGEIQPMWIIEGPKETVPVVTMFSGMPGEKEAVHSFIRDKAKEIDAYVVGFIAEAWQITRGKDDNIDVAPSECDDRVEVIQVMAEDRWGLKMGHYLIHRDKDRPYLSPFELMEDTTEITGRFIGSLEKFNA